MEMPQSGPHMPAEPSRPGGPGLLPPIPAPERPRLADGVQLHGAVRDTGFERPQWLVERSGRFIQVTELLYHILVALDGEKTLDEIAAEVAEQTGRPVIGANVRTLIEARLLPMRLIAPASPPPDSAVAPLAIPPLPTAAALPTPLPPGAPAPADISPRPPARSPLQLTLRVGFLGADAIEPVARVLQVLFAPPILIPLVALALAGQAWLFFVHGIFGSVQAVLDYPLTLLLISAFILVSALFHEFGHASALRYGGARARGMGFGVYLMFPALYTDSTESYRLGRWGRLRTDLGGIYFDLIVSLGLLLLYAATHQEVLLAAVLLLDLEMADQFSPLMRYDGYWALADLVGVPDFFAFMGPVVRDMLPARLARLGPFARWRASGRKVPPLKGWVRVAFVSYLLIALPILAGSFLLLIVFAPTFFGMQWNALLMQIIEGILAWRDHAPGEVAVAAINGLLLLVTVGFFFYGLYRLLRSLIGALLRWGGQTSRRQAFAVAITLTVYLLLSLAWLPQLAPWTARAPAPGHAAPHSTAPEPTFTTSPPR